MDAQAEFRNLCDKMSDEIVKPFTTQKEFIYIDSDMLYDYRLGAMLAQIRNEKDYAYIQQCIPEYLKSPTLECAKFFPEMNLTDEQLDKIIVDPNNYVFISAASPATKFINDLGTMIKIFNSINESKESHRPLHVTINQRKIAIHPKYQRGIIDLIHAVDDTVIVKFSNYKSWFEVPEQLLQQQDFICVYDMIEFLQEGSNSQKLLSSIPSKLGKAIIVAPIQSDLKVPTEESFRNLKTMLEVMCDKFSFVPKTILTEGNENG